MINCNATSNFTIIADYIGRANEVATLATDGTIPQGSTFLAVDTKKVYILYDSTWWEL